MTPRPAPAQVGSQILPVWRGHHRGDGPVRCFPAGAATLAQVDPAAQGARERLTELVGPLRAGDVQFLRFGPGRAESVPAGVDFAEAIGVHLEADLLTFLRSEPLSTLVLALCPTDRISRRTPPRRKGRRR